MLYDNPTAMPYPPNPLVVIQQLLIILKKIYSIKPISKTRGGHTQVMEMFQRDQKTNRIVCYITESIVLMRLHFLK